MCHFSCGQECRIPINSVKNKNKTGRRSRGRGGLVSSPCSSPCVTRLRRPSRRHLHFILRKVLTRIFFEELSLTTPVDSGWKSRHPFLCLAALEQPELSLALPLAAGQLGAHLAVPCVAVPGQRPSAGRGSSGAASAPPAPCPSAGHGSCVWDILVPLLCPRPREHPGAWAVPPPLAGAARWGEALCGPPVLVAGVMAAIPSPSLYLNEAVYLAFLPD